MMLDAKLRNTQGDDYKPVMNSLYAVKFINR
ncbi:hypothetical protein GILI108418_10305 [Gillisia limnaea]|uniref:Uncharacterized protein n=1 Tax=Gillisia limnaea (strain DSM 15749 / LMG 21470 / R-8282) TaxID=865937 RepID=H2BUP8_GILLR|nr:hypothetical protein Gilli_1022 [Gillisia limnaea DSM 15749]